MKVPKRSAAVEALMNRKSLIGDDVHGDKVRGVCVCVFLFLMPLDKPIAHAYSLFLPSPLTLS